MLKPNVCAFLQAENVLMRYAFDTIYNSIIPNEDSSVAVHTGSSNINGSSADVNAVSIQVNISGVQMHTDRDDFDTIGAQIDGSGDELNAIGFHVDDSDVGVNEALVNQYNSIVHVNISGFALHYDNDETQNILLHLHNTSHGFDAVNSQLYNVNTFAVGCIAELNLMCAFWLVGSFFLGDYVAKHIVYLE